MYEQREIKFYLVSLDFASTLYIKFFSLTLKVNSKHCKLRGLLFFSSLSTQLIQKFLFTSFFFFWLGYFSTLDLLYFWTFSSSDSLYLHSSAFVFHVDLYDICIIYVFTVFDHSDFVFF